jgi:hypothetical protein
MSIGFCTIFSIFEGNFQSAKKGKITGKIAGNTLKNERIWLR